MNNQFNYNSKYYKIEFVSGEYKMIKSNSPYVKLTKKLFFEYGPDIKSIHSATFDDIKWFGQNDVIRELN